MATSVDFRCLTISADNGKPWMDERGQYHYRYRVTIKSDATNRRTWFTFTDSIADYEAGKRGLGPDDLLWAFRCFVDDAITGQESFEDFADDFGCDHDSYAARQTHKACQEAWRKMQRLFHAEPDPYDIIGELSDMGVE